MLKFRVVAAVVALAVLAQVPVTVLAAAGPAKVATSATQLTAAEMARYSQLQADAQGRGVLSSEKGGASDTTWTIVGIVVGVAIVVGVFTMINDID